MNNIYLTNSFTLNMIGERRNITINAIPMTMDEAKFLLNRMSFINAIGHEDTARIVGEMLGTELNSNRINIEAERFDSVFVAQYTGPRLPEGTKTLPENSKIEFWLVNIF